MEQSNVNYSFEFHTFKTPDEVYEILKNVRQWWSGLYGEKIVGESEKVGDIFSFSAGDGIHHSVQKLVEAVPAKRLWWLVTESQLTFLEDPTEWNNSHFGFDISEESGGTKITFTHDGLTPNIECYNSCSDAWTLYMQKLHDGLK